MKKWLMLWLLFCPPAYANWDDYLPGTLAATAAKGGAGKSFELRQALPVSAKVEFGGDFRPLSFAAKLMLADYFKVDPNFPPYAWKYRYEVRLVEAGVEYWSPLHTQLVSAMRKGLSRGEEITAMLRLIGSENGRPIFLLDEFSADSRKP